MLSFHEPVNTDFEAVNRLIIDELKSDVILVEDIGQHLIDAGGKRLRPLLVLLMAKANNYVGTDHHRLAAAIEFIHTATLLHDDVVDVSSMRRGKKTANAKWGNAPSVLVGDFLYSRAFQVMVSMANIEVMRVISDTTNTIAEGEVQQLVNANNANITEDNYLSVIYKKTSALFEAGCELAAIISNAKDEQRTYAKRYGYHLGLAFQLIDDALDYTGDAQALGKNIGDDLAEGKPTLPLIFAMKKGSVEQRHLIAHAIECGQINQLDDIIHIINSTGALDYTMDLAKQHSQHAIESLHWLDDSDYKSALISLAEFAVFRNH